MNTTLSVMTSLQTQVHTAETITPKVELSDADSVVRPATEHAEVARFDSISALRLLTGQIFRSLALLPGTRPLIDEDLGFEPPINADAAGAQLAGAVRGLLGTQQPSAESTDPAAEPQAITQRVAAGIEAGYQETVRLLAQKGPVPSDVQIELQQSREFAFAAVAEIGAAGNATNAQVAGVQAAEATNSSTASITVQTRDGDTVSLEISSLRSSRITAAAIGDDEGAAVSLTAEQANKFQFSLNVNGELDRGETKAIRKLMHQITGVLKKFAQADYGKAIRKFGELKINTELLANVAMDLSNRRSIAVAGLYAAAATALPAADAGSVPAVAAPVAPGDAPDTTQNAPEPARYQSAGTAIHLAATRSASYSPNIGTQQQTGVSARVSYSLSTSPASPDTSQAAIEEAGPEVIGLAELLAPFVSLFRDLLGSSQFSAPGKLIAGLAATMLELQPGLLPSETNTDADSDAEADVEVKNSDDDHGAMKNLLRDFMGALDHSHSHGHDHDKPEKHSTHESGHGRSDAPNPAAEKKHD